jgi:hypothetical protein
VHNGDVGRIIGAVLLPSTRGPALVLGLLVSAGAAIAAFAACALFGGDADASAVKHT